MERIAIFGLGNVALDCARMLLRGEDAIGRTDIARHAQEALKRSTVKARGYHRSQGPSAGKSVIHVRLPPSQKSGLHTQRRLLQVLYGMFAWVWALSDGFSCRLSCYTVQ